MDAITNNVRLATEKNFKAEVKQYSYTIQLSKKSKYGSIANMKRHLLSEFSTYSEEDLDFLHEYIKAKSIRSDKVISSYLPVWVAICISMFNVFFNSTIINTIAILIISIFLFFLIISTDYSEEGINRLNFCTMALEIIEKIEQKRGHTFNDSLVESNEISTTIN